MADFPRSLPEFQRRFPNDAACAVYLAEARWPKGFVCPCCGHGRAWRLKSKANTYECSRCHRQTSVTAGTVMHASKLALSVWFWAAYLMATHSNGICEPLAGLVEVDETTINYRTKADPPHRLGWRCRSANAENHRWRRDEPPSGCLER